MFEMIRQLRAARVALASIALALAATGGTFTEYAIPTPNSRPLSITVGPDGALWFTESFGFKIGRITTSGQITEYTLPPQLREPQVIATGPDGALWFTAALPNNALGSVIGRVTTGGDFTWYDEGIGNEQFAYGIAPGPDGKMWFALNAQIANISMSGKITLFPQQNLYIPTELTVAPNGTIFFPAPGAHAYSIVGMSPSGTETFYSVPLVKDGRGVTFVAMGPNGRDVWFLRAKDTVGKLDATGKFTEFFVPIHVHGMPFPEALTAGPDGAMWFTNNKANTIGRVTQDGRFSIYPVPSPNTYLGWIVTGPDGALWFTENSANKIGRFMP
jgi:virginiamycin B lyase